MILSKSSPDSVIRTAEVLKASGVVVIPTDTVYGFSTILGPAGEQIRKIKGREKEKPFIQLISNPTDIFNITNDKIPETLISKWPGALSIIVSDKNDSSKTVCVRCPGDAWLREVISQCGSPIYSTSVNRSGQPVLTKISEIIEEFEEEVGLIIDSGDSFSAVPSTIVRVEGEKIVVVREGQVKI